MIRQTDFTYKPGEHENEKASNSYLMSLVALMAGLPLPIVNLIASLFFYLGNRKGTLFVKWHCLQALLSQSFLFVFNSISFWWTFSILFAAQTASNEYFAYLFTVIVLNLLEIVSTVYAAVQVRKGKHVELFFFGSLTNLIYKTKL